MQHLGNDTVRAVALLQLDGLQRGIKAIDTGAPVTIKVGEKHWPYVQCYWGTH